MKIFLLEDNNDKAQSIKSEILTIAPGTTIQSSTCFADFLKSVHREKYDLIVVDLLVPRFPDEVEATDVTEEIIDTIRDHRNINFRTPVIAITQFLEAAEANFVGLNQKDIYIVTFDSSTDDWKKALHNKVSTCLEHQAYDFVVICALPKETSGFVDAGFKVGPIKSIHGMECRDLELAQLRGIIITLPRMGLVNCAISCSRAIDIFKPRLVCMSGICAGVKGEVNIYDVVIPDSCQQHDFGKWGVTGFQPESYTVQIPNEVKLIVRQLAEDNGFIERVTNSIKPKRDEIPDGVDYFNFKIMTAHASSGSAVIADESMVALIREHHRKTKTFEMESYSIYESARLAPTKPIYFSAKSVVDNGDTHKGDHYHRLGCNLSAQVTCELIQRILPS